jgi:sarcosine oxidase/L-pipecolate oxidase
MIASTSASDLPKGLDTDSELFVPCGLIRFAMEPELSQYDEECLVELDKAGLRHWQHVIVGSLGCFVEFVLIRLLGR